MSNAPKLRVAVVGCGRMGRQRALAATAWGADVVCVHDQNAELAGQLAAELPGCTPLDDAKSLNWDDLDALFVCTPPVARGPMESSAAAHGVAVFVEKPVGLSAEHFQPILQAVQSANVVNAVGYMNRYRDSVLRAREIVAGQSVLGVSAHWLCGRYRVPWWGREDHSGGPINEQATHLVDLVRFLCGEVLDVRGIISPPTATGGDFQAAAFTLRLENGGVCSMCYSCEATEKMIGMQIFTPQRRVFLDGWDFRLRDEEDGSFQLPADVDRNTIFRTETDAFLNAVLAGTQGQILSAFEDAIKTQRVVDALRRSVETGGMESVPRPMATPATERPVSDAA